MTASARAARRRIPGRAALLGLSGASLAGALVLLWWLLPFGGGTGDLNAGGPSSATTSAPNTTSAPKPTVSPTGAAPAARKSAEPESGSLLTPDGIRTAIKALEEDTGRNMFGDFTVYPDHVSAELMVNGSKSAYDSYTYRPGQGVEKGIINGTLPGGDQPLSLDDFNWDRVPALFEEARKKLNVDDPDLRYLSVRQPDDIFDTPAGMAVYLTDDHGRAGYLEADTDGKVTRVMPAED
ncbi:hypothetical protein ABIE67_008895 [Streptomyces sp. V4I8]